MANYTSDNDEGTSGTNQTEMIKLHISLEEAKTLVERLYGVNVCNIKELYSYDDKNYFVQVSENHCNPHIKDMWPCGYVLKILNSISSQEEHYGKTFYILSLKEWDMFQISSCHLISICF